MILDDLDRTAAIARALGHPARLRILAMLRSGELCVCQLTAVLGLATSTVSAHLRELRLAGLVRERKEGRFVHFGLAGDGVAATWVECALHHIGGDDRIARDDLVVADLRCVPIEELCRTGVQSRRPAAEPRARRRTTEECRDG